MNDSLVLVDRIRLNIAQGMRAREAVRAAGGSRFKAVTVTSITTIAGLFPPLIERSAQAPSSIPMAVSIAFGLASATVLLLVVVPVLFSAVDDLRHYMSRLVMPATEAFFGVKPAMPSCSRRSARDFVEGSSASLDG